MRHLGKEGIWAEPALGLHGRNGGDDPEPRRCVKFYIGLRAPDAGSRLQLVMVT